MARVRCLLIEPTDMAERSLRRYYGVRRPDLTYDEAVARGKCSVNPMGIHNAATPIEPEPVIPDEQNEGYIKNGSQDDHPHDDPRWPTACMCGFQFDEHDAWQVFVERLYRRADTGEECALRDAPVGAMWYAPWMDVFHPQGPHALVVKLPDNTDWIVDMSASNCNWPGGDHSQEHHHCWPYKGTPPDITVDKSFGTTCTAGAGSIATKHYHGFLRNGYLED